MSPKRIPSLTVLTLAALSAVLRPARADYQFTYTSFDAPVGPPTAPYAGSGAFGLSNSGAIVGLTTTDDTTYNSYLRRANGSFTTLNYPGSVTGDANTPLAVNSAGIVTGEFFDTSGNQTNYIYNSATNAFSSPAHANAPNGTFYQGVNDAGQIAAQYIDAGNVTHSAIYSLTTGAFTDLPDVPASLGINTQIQAVNVKGDYVANYTDSGGNIQAALHHNGVYSSLMFPGADSTRADSINSSGVIAGRYYANGGATEEGFLYDSGKFYTIDFPGSIVTDVRFGFNDSDQIAGYYVDQSNVLHSFTAQATDVPEPSACALLIAA